MQVLGLQRRSRSQPAPAGQDDEILGWAHWQSQDAKGVQHCAEAPITGPMKGVDSWHA